MSDLLEHVVMVSHDWWAWMAPMAWQVSALALVVWGLTALLRKHSPHLRYWLWMLVLVRLVLPPTLSLPTGVGNVVQPPPPLRPEYVGYDMAWRAQSEPRPHQYSVSTAVPPAAPPLSVTVPFYSWLFAAWLLGALTVLGLLVAQYMRIRKRFGSAVPATALQPLLAECCERMRVGRGVQAVLCRDLPSPVLCGLLRPRICLPAAMAEQLSSERIRPILMHELAHLRRGDLWVNLVQLVLQAVYWFNPFVLLANMRLRAERELIVDDAVLSAMGESREVYGESLLSAAPRTASKWTVAPGLVGIGEDSAEVAQRVKRIMDSRRKLYVRLGVVSAVVVVVAALVLIPQARGEGWPFMQKNSVHSAFDIPKLDGISVDGSAGDWGDRGFSGSLVGMRGGAPIRPDGFRVSYRLGWTDNGLVVLLDVRARAFAENKSAAFWERDAVELFLADSVGGGRLLQTMVSPGVSAQRSQLASRVIEWFPAWKELFGETAGKVKTVRQAVPGGYTMEALLPWELVGLSPTLGRTVGFQLSVATWDETAGLGRATWYPARPGGNTQLLQPLRLAERAGGYKPSVAVGTEVVDQNQLRWNFACEKCYSGRPISVRRGPRVLAESVLKTDGEIASASCLAPRVEYAEPEGPAEVIVDNPGGSHFVCPVWVDALPALGFARPVRSPDGEVRLPGLTAYEGLRGGMLRELLGCANYVGYRQSDAWLAGVSGFAFAINVPSDLCPSGPSAWADADLLPLAANAGLFVDVKTFDTFKDMPDIAQRRKQMFQWVQAAINDGRPTVGTGMVTPETYLVCGYDGQGNYLYIEPGDSAPRKRNYADLQSAFFMFPRLGPAMDDRAAVVNALVTALALADGSKYNDKACGLRAYDNWIAGLTAVAANAANSGHGAAYNAAVWAGHRQFVVPFLKEARKRLNAPDLKRLFDAAIKQYGMVADNLDEVSRLFPLSSDRQAMQQRFTDEGVGRQARDALQAAKAAETEGVKALGALLDAIGRPDTSRPADLAARATQAYERISAEMRSTDSDGSTGYVGDLDGYLTELLISAKLNGWDDLSYHTLCAVAGSSGLFAYDPRDFMGKYANRSIGMDKRIAEATGYVIEWVKWKDIEDSWRILKESIDSGKPVMAEFYEMCSWVGYREDSIKEKRWVYMLPGPGPGEAGWKTWEYFADWFKRFGGFYGAWGRLGARVEPAPQADVAKRVIQDLVSWSKAPYPGAPPADRDKNLYGLAGIRAYASDILAKDDEYWDSPWAGCHAIQPQRAFRYATVVYLESLVTRKVLDPAATKAVAAAAAEYRLAWQQWMIWERQLGRSATGTEVWKNAEHRRAGGQAIVEAAKHEEKAIGHLRTVIDKQT